MSNVYRGLAQIKFMTFELLHYLWPSILDCKFYVVPLVIFKRNVASI
jgi:hypothetical protein